MKEVCSAVTQCAQKDEPVLFQREQGTGKAVLARMLHALSRSADSLFENIDCANLREGGSVGALIGYSKTGTMLFDEIGQMPNDLHKELEGILLKRQYRESSGAPPEALQTRLLFSTRRRVDKLVKEGRFDESLQHMLQPNAITVPPSRERPEDLRIYIGLLLRESVRENESPIEPDALLVLEKYLWPGNLPELTDACEMPLSFREDIGFSSSICRGSLCA